MIRPKCSVVLSINFYFKPSIKLTRIKDSESDIKSLQVAIDRLENWSAENRLRLNASKKFHVNYIGTERIEQKSVMRDLGIIFDSKLKFKNHIEDTVHRAYYFTKEIRCFKVILKIINVYITPINEYFSIVWSGRSMGEEKSLKRVLHKSTLLALNITRYNAPNFREFETRMKLCGLATYKSRRIIASIIWTIRVFSCEIQTELTTSIRSMLYESTSHRHPRIFDIPRSVPVDSPLYYLMSYVNRYKNVFEMFDSVAVIKQKLRTFFGSLPMSQQL